MRFTRYFRWLPAVTAAAVLAVVGWLSQAPLHDWTHARLSERHVARLARLPEPRAALLVRELALAEEEWLEVFVRALADERPAVAAAGRAALLDCLWAWGEAQPAAGHSTNAARLAGLLATHAPRMKAEQRSAAQSLAQRLLECPLDGRQIDAARLISDCELVLSLPRHELADYRLAIAPAEPVIEASPMPEATPPLAPPEQPAVSPPLPQPMQPAPVAEPPRLSPPVDAQAAAPVEPRRMAKPSAVRISDD